MNSVLANWKTTVLGAGAIFTALGDALTQIASGHFSSTLSPDIAAIITGIGLIMAADYSNSSTKGK